MFQAIIIIKLLKTMINIESLEKLNKEKIRKF